MIRRLRAIFAAPSRVRLPRRTARLRLTLVYGGLFLVSAVILVTIANVLTRSGALFWVEHNGTVQAGQAAGGRAPVLVMPSAGLSPEVLAQITNLQALAQHQRDADVEQFLITSGIALAVMTMGSIAVGWIVAGRVLSPVRTITMTARQIGASSLHERLAIVGPDDEFKDLGDTLDDLFGRLEAAFRSQRNFVANASHELRTPLTAERTLLQVALADPNASAATLRAACERILAFGRDQERLIEALLTLTNSERGLEHREPVNLSAVTQDVLHTPQPEAERGDVNIETSISPASLAGDQRLVRRMVANLVDNAVHHNVPGGRVEVATQTRDGCAVLTVENTGPLVPPSEVDRLFQPFQRLSRTRSGEHNGQGLGLSIVQAIATAHGATVTAKARPQGGMTIEVRFPAGAATGATISGGRPTAAARSRERGKAGGFVGDARDGA